jgi:hypothetical protein
MKLINADELEPDTEWSDYYDGFVSYSKSQIDAAEEVKAIPLDEVKQAKEKIEKLNLNDYADNLYKFQTKCTGILDKLIKKRGGNTADVELAIKVPEEVYDAVMHKNSKHLELDAFYVIDKMGKAIANGTPLPEGYWKGSVAEWQKRK